MLKIAWHPIYHLPLPAGHRFPMEKYSLLPEQLIREGTCRETDFFQPELPAIPDLLSVHDAEYVKNISNLNLDPGMIRRIGFPLDNILVEREFRIMQGTLTATLFALQYGISFNIAGGTHHAFSDRGEGFCLLNDNAIAAQYLINNDLARKILIVDLDVHQGNGTAAIFRGNDQVFTFSMNGKNNFPFHKEQSDLDIPLEDGTDDQTYLKLLDYHLKQLIDEVQPDFIFYQCGVDILEQDQMGKLACTLSGCRQRDMLVFQTARRHRIPIAADMGGGYAPDIRTILEAHANTYRTAVNLYF